MANSRTRSKETILAIKKATKEAAIKDKKISHLVKGTTVTVKEVAPSPRASNKR